jgi:polyhydroxyalkanoate synthesis repressor PhaR
MLSTHQEDMDIIMINETLVYRKYGNRRLYDTGKSCYVTLDDIAEVVRQGRQVQVVDAKTKEDVTAFILTQILLEASRKKNFLLPVPLLHLIIQFGGNVLNEFFQKYLEQIIKSYISYQTAADEQFRKWLDMGSGFPNMPPLQSFMDFFPNTGSAGAKEKKQSGS